MSDDPIVVDGKHCASCVRRFTSKGATLRTFGPRMGDARGSARGRDRPA